MTASPETTGESTPEPPAATSKDGGLDPAILKIAAVVVLGSIMSILDMTVVNVAIPTFQEQFHATYAVVAWTLTGYTLALAAVIPVTGWAADRFGTKRLYMLALFLFVLGSVLCSMAWDITSLVAFRVVQGLGGGMLMPLGMTMLTKAAGPDRMGRVMAVLGIPMLLGPIAGPILGGWLIDAASWHWIFLINLPLGIIAILAAWIILPRDNPTPSESFDIVGMALLSPGLASFLFGVSSTPETGSVTAPRVWVFALIGVVLIAAFVRHALHAQHPLIDLRLFRDRSMTTAVITSGFFIMAFMGTGLLLPTYFLQVRGETTLQAGLLLAPQGFGAMLTMPIAGRMVDKIGPGKIVLVGITMIFATMIFMTQLGANTSYPAILAVLFVMGMGMGCTMMPIMTAALKTLAPASIARGSTLMNINQQIWASVGTALMSVLLTNNLKDRPLGGAAVASRTDPAIADQLGPQGLAAGFDEAAKAFGNTYIAAAVLLVVTWIAAWFLPRKASSGPVHAPAPIH